MSTKPKPFCFVLMPFDSSFDDIYEFGIRGACSDAEVYCERVDEQIFQGSMLDRIYNQIARADVIVADMTGKNPNVFYEVGYAHALGKRTILLTQQASDIPFDLKHFPHIVYGAKIKDLRDDLAKRVRRFAYDESQQCSYELGLELYWNDKPLSQGNVTATYALNKVPNTKLTIHNTSAATYEPGDFRIGVLTPPEFSISRRPEIAVTRLPDGTYLHMLPVGETLFPGAYSTVFISIDSPAAVKYDGVGVTIRIFSSAGSRDYPLRLERAKQGVE